MYIYCDILRLKWTKMKQNITSIYYCKLKTMIYNLSFQV